MLPPEVYQGCEHNADEDHHFDVTAPAELTEGDGPSDDEHRFEVEDHKKHGDQVKLDRQAHACGTGGDDPRFVGFACGGSLMSLPQDV
jgi:hypothetical protein